MAASLLQRMEPITLRGLPASNLTTSAYEKITVVYCVRTQLLHGLRAKRKDRAETGISDEESIIRDIKFNSFNTSKKRGKINKGEDYPTRIVKGPIKEKEVKGEGGGMGRE